MGLSLNRLKVILERRKQINFHRVLRVLPRQVSLTTPSSREGQSFLKEDIASSNQNCHECLSIVQH